MRFKVTRLTENNGVIEFTITTNKTAHSILSDNPQMEEEIRDAIHLIITKYKRGIYEKTDQPGN